VIQNEHSVYLHLYKSRTDSHLQSVHQNDHLQMYKAKWYKIKTILSHDFSTFFHMPFKDHISNLSQIITQYLSSDKNTLKKKNLQIKYFLVDIPVNLPQKYFTCSKFQQQKALKPNLHHAQMDNQRCYLLFNYR